MTQHAAILRPASSKTNDCGGGARTTPLVTRSCGSTSLINGITAFAKAAPLFLRARGCRSVHLERGIENPSIYILVVGWDRI